MAPTDRGGRVGASVTGLPFVGLDMMGDGMVSDGAADKKQEKTRERSWGLYRKSLRESLNPTVSLSQPLCLVKSRREKQDEEEKPWLQARQRRKVW